MARHHGFFHRENCFSTLGARSTIRAPSDQRERRLKQQAPGTGTSIDL